MNKIAGNGPMRRRIFIGIVACAAFSSFGMYFEKPTIQKWRLSDTAKEQARQQSITYKHLVDVMERGDPLPFYWYYKLGNKEYAFYIMVDTQPDEAGVYTIADINPTSYSVHQFLEDKMKMNKRKQKEIDRPGQRDAAPEKEDPPHEEGSCEHAHHAIKITPHAVKRMKERKITVSNIHCILSTGYSLRTPDNPKRITYFGTLPDPAGRHIGIVAEKKPGSDEYTIITVVVMNESKFQRYRELALEVAKN